MKIDNETGERLWDKHQKDKVLKHLYKKKKPPKQKEDNGHYDVAIDFHLDED